MVAALIVMMGHLLHIKGSTSGFLIGSHLDKIFSSGPFAVVVFFGLSGIALRFQTDRYGIDVRWLVARIIRLMPVYWITLLLPIIGCYLLGVKIEYPGYGFIVAALGLQAVAKNLYIPPVNGPLWSLSVELYLSASLLAIGRWKRISGFYVLTILVIINLFFPGNTILQGLPIFYLGFLLPRIEILTRLNSVIKTVTILIPLIFLLFYPIFIQARFQGKLNFLFCTFLASLIILWTLFETNTKRNLFADLSQRSYSLYAVHAPIVLFIDKIFFADRITTNGLQILISLTVIFIATEFLYRFIEKPSIKYSRKYLTNQAL